MAVAGDTISVLCACGKKLKAPASAAGRKGKCPACGNVLTMTAGAAAPAREAPTTVKPPAPPAPVRRPLAAPLPSASPQRAKTSVPPPPPPPAPAEDDDLLGGMYELAEAERQAAEQPNFDDAPRCPGCAAPATGGAVLCVNCGYNFKTGAQLSTTSAAAAAPKPGRTASPQMIGKKPGKPGKPIDMMAPQGLFVTGLLLSAAFAALGGILSGMVIWFTGYDIFFLSIITGVLAGVGMVMGQKGYSNLGGATAAGITLLTIILARVIVVYLILLPKTHALSLSSSSAAASAENFAAETGKYDPRVVNMLVEENLKVHGVQDPEDATDAQQRTAQRVALGKLKSATPDEYQQMVAKAKEREETEELTAQEAEELFRQRNPPRSDGKQVIQAMMAANKEAKAKVEAMTPEQRRAEVARLHVQADAAAKPAAPDAADDTDGASDGAGGGAGGNNNTTAARNAGRAVGASVALLLIFGLRHIITTCVSLAIAYRTASGSVSG